MPSNPKSSSSFISNRFFYFLFCSLVFGVVLTSSCKKKMAEDESPPLIFSFNDFEKIIGIVNKRHIDRKKIDETLAYVSAAKSALNSLPFPIKLMSESFHKKRENFKEEDDVVIKKKIKVATTDKYYLIIPDYKKWRENQKSYSKKRKEEFKKLSNTEKKDIILKERAKAKEKREAKDEAWQSINFNNENFISIIRWIEREWRSYLKKPPSLTKKKKKKKKHPFSLNQVYFRAAEGFLESVDPHSSISNKVSWDKMLKKSQDSTFEGIGALLRGGGENDVLVETPLLDSPALKAGLRAGDIIRKVDKKDIADFSLKEVVNLIRGPKNTTVVLHVERTLSSQNLDVKIQRGVISQKAVRTRLLTQKELGKENLKKMKIAFIRLTSFLYKDVNERPSKLILQEFNTLKEKNKGKIDALILDLRGNSGGYLKESVNIADLFLPKDKLVVSVASQIPDPKIQLQKNKKLFNAKELRTKIAVQIDVPLIVLINASSASASEILASALLDHNRALILGDRSFGKATVQSVQPYRSVVVKLTTARYYAPLGYTVQAYGLEPDIYISDEEDNEFPLRFREEDMWRHLPKLEKRSEDLKRKTWLKKNKQFC